MDNQKPITIYYLTRNPAAKRAIKQRFRIRGESVNGESQVSPRDQEELRLLQECQRRGFIKIRNK